MKTASPQIGGIATVTLGSSTIATAALRTMSVAFDRGDQRIPKIGLVCPFHRGKCTISVIYNSTAKVVVDHAAFNMSYYSSVRIGSICESTGSPAHFYGCTVQSSSVSQIELDRSWIIENQLTFTFQECYMGGNEIFQNSNQSNNDWEFT